MKIKVNYEPDKSGVKVRIKNVKYRIIKRDCWWTSIFTTGTPQFLYYDFDLEHFEIGSYKMASRYKWEFSKGDLDTMKKDYDLDDEFIIERVRGKGDKI